MNATPGQTGNDASSGEPTVEWELRLYVAGQSARSVTAFANLKKLCEAHLAGKYRIEVIDLLENPQLSRDDQIVAIPTLVRTLPSPIRKIIGDLSNTEKTLVGLQLRPAAREEREAIMNEPKVAQPPVRTPRPIRRDIGCASMSVARHRDPRRRSPTSRRSARDGWQGRYELEVIDAYQQAELTSDQQIVVLPTLIKSLPRPLRRMVGDLSDEEHVLLGLGLGLEEVNPDDDTE